MVPRHLQLKPARRIRGLGPALLALAVSACTTTQAPSQRWPAPDDGISYPQWPSPQPQPAPPGETQPQPQPQQYYPRSAAEVSGPAVMALITQAQDQRVAGNLDVAAATLDRARRLEPRNPFVWIELAKTQLSMDQAAEAEATAQRARTFARGNPFIEVELWDLIAQSRAQQGDAAGASMARGKADEAARKLPPS